VGAAEQQRVVVGVDGSAGARLALGWALAEAARRGAQVEVVAAFPVDFYWADPSLVDTRRVDALRADTAARVRTLVHEVRRDPVVAATPGIKAVTTEVVVCPGPAVAHLVQRSEGAALLVVGSRGRGAVRSTMAGSVALHSAAHARCPVVVVHPAVVPSAYEPARVVVGLDDSDQARAALAAAVAEAARLGARVDAVVAYEEPDTWSSLYAVATPPGCGTREQALRRAEEVVEEVLGAAPLQREGVRVRAVEGDPAQVLTQEAQGARLLVVGSRSRNQLEGIVLGSVALHCVMRAPCPVLVVHPPRHGGAPAPARAAAAVPTA
jgi:nucleotide-binding universal stress UspA family protein